MRYVSQTINCLAVAMLSLILSPSHCPADGPADNAVENVRRVPKLGIEVPEADRVELQASLDSLATKIEQLHRSRGSTGCVPDVQIFHRAVDQALRFQEFFDAKEIPIAKQLLAMGHQRADDLKIGRLPWLREKGLVVRGYLSKLDQTVQPYGVVIPDEYDYYDGNTGNAAQLRHRCDIWFHGRGETLSELNFIHQRLQNKGEYTPAGTFVLHPYGRYCNANKFAGEVDTFEVLEHASKSYRFNHTRIAVRGFSMGGAACWQFAVHYPAKWFAANPGAGFSETPDFLKVFQNETLAPTWYEEKLWRMYDCTGYAANLAFLPTIAYSGDMDKQKQAADIMEVALKQEGLPLQHVIGPMTGHKIHPDSKLEIEKTLSRWERLGTPTEMGSPLKADGWETVDQFVTYTLRYDQSRCITILGMDEHWEQARVVVQQKDSAVRIRTQNVSEFQLAGKVPALNGRFTIEIDGQPITASNPRLQGLVIGAGLVFRKTDGKWTQLAGKILPEGLSKRHGLQGPIDDAFMDAFVFVKPSSPGVSPEIDAWVKAEFEHAVEHWRRHFRGDVRVMLDTEITKYDMQRFNIVVWGDPKSNEVLTVMQEQLPIHWQLADNTLQVGETTYDAATHLPLLIFPNPLAPNKYVVLNSSFTFREYDYLNNARQTPKLPDWAIVDVRTPANSRFPGKIVDANFFDEVWQLKPAK